MEAFTQSSGAANGDGGAEDSPWAARPQGQDLQYDAYWRLNCPSTGDPIEAFFPDFRCWSSAKFLSVDSEGRIHIQWTSDDSISVLPEDAVRPVNSTKPDPAVTAGSAEPGGLNPELLKLLRLARSKWRDKDVYAAAEKLRSIGICEVTDLHDAIESQLEGDENGVNRRLQRCGLKIFAEATLYALRYNPRANRGEAPPPESECRSRRTTRGGATKTSKPPNFDFGKVKEKLSVHVVRHADWDERHEDFDDEDEDDFREGLTSQEASEPSDTVWIASMETVYLPATAQSSCDGSVYDTEEEYYDSDGSPGAVAYAPSTPRQEAREASEEYEPEDGEQAAVAFLSWLQQKPAMMRLSVPDRSVGTGIAWDFPLAKSEKRELLLQHIAAGERMAQEDASEAAREVEIAQAQTRRTRQSLESCKSALARRRKSVSVRRRKSLGG